MTRMTIRCRCRWWKQSITRFDKDYFLFVIWKPWTDRGVDFVTFQRHTVIRKNTFYKQCFSSSRRQIKQRLLAIEHANLISMLNCLYLVTIMYYSSIIYLYLESLWSGHFCLFQNVCYTHLELRHWVVYQRFYRVVLIIKLCIDYFC